MGGLEAPVAERLREVLSTPPPKPGHGAARSPIPVGGAPDRSLPQWGMPGPDRGFTDPPAGAAANRWRVALTKQDLRWMTTDEIAQAYRAGAVKDETFVFRTGMPTWVTLVEVPEIARALAGEGAEHSPPESSPIPSPTSSAAEHSSRPPPRRGKARREEAAASSGHERPLSDAEPEDPEDQLPFALVSERANGKKNVAVSAQTTPLAHDAFLTLPLTDARAAELTPSAFETERKPPAYPNAPIPPMHPALNGTPSGDLAMTSGSPMLEPLPPSDLPEPMPFAAARQAEGSSRWTWITIAVLLIAAAVALIGPRFGFKLL